MFQNADPAAGKAEQNIHFIFVPLIGNIQQPWDQLAPEGTESGLHIINLYSSGKAVYKAGKRVSKPEF